MNGLPTVVGIVAAILLMAGCGADRALDSEIKQKRELIEQLTHELDAAVGATLPQDREVIAMLRYRPVSAYLHEITDNGIMVSASGVSTEGGEFWYSGGFGRAWLAPPQDTKASITLRGVNLAGSDSGIAWSSKLWGQAEGRAYFDILRQTGNILCSGGTGGIEGLSATGTLSFAAQLNSRLGYSLQLSQPSDINVHIKCGLKFFPDLHINLPIRGLARELAKGEVGIGLATDGRFEVPIGDEKRSYTYAVTTREPVLMPMQDGLLYKSDVDVTISPLTVVGSSP